MIKQVIIPQLTAQWRENSLSELYEFSEVSEAHFMTGKNIFCIVKAHFSQKICKPCKYIQCLNVGSKRYSWNVV